MDIRTIQLMLGHSTMTVTQRYLNVTDEEVRRQMEQNRAPKKQNRLKAVGAAASA